MPGLYGILKKSPATQTKPGAVKQAPPQVDSTAVDVAAVNVQFNLLLGKLRASGVLAP